MDVLRETLLAQARAKGICADGFRTLGECEDKAALLAYYVANPDWCMEHDFPSMETLRRDFSDCEGMGVYVDREFHGELLNGRLVYVLHNCRGEVRTGLNLKMGIIPMIYICNGSKVRLRGEESGERGKERGSLPSRLPVYIFGKNDVRCKDGGGVRFVKYRFDMV